MKSKFTLFFILLGSLLHAQSLYTTASDISYANGTICKLDTATNQLAAVFHFTAESGNQPFSGLFLNEEDGKLYGTVSKGAANDRGAIFSFDPATGTYEKLKEFSDSLDGASPQSGLIRASDGKLYGVTSKGGTANLGVIFSYDMSTATYKKLKDFTGADGAAPAGNLVQAKADGLLYGITSEGGVNNNGVIYGYDIVTSTFVKRADFSTLGITTLPYGALANGNDNMLYGMGNFSLYSFNPLDFTVKVLVIFDASTGTGVRGSLLLASDSAFYGMTASGVNQCLFSFNPATSTFIKLHQFINYETGVKPYGTVMQASNKKLYGVTYDGGNQAQGVAFSYDIPTATYTKLADFNSFTGGFPLYTYFTEVLCKNYYRDADNDGYGDAGTKLFSCSGNISGYVTNGLDCNDSNAAVHPGAGEICDGIDNDCDGEIDEGCTGIGIRITAKDVVAKELQNGYKSFNFNVKLNLRPAKIVKVNYRTVDSTAKAGSDYVATSGTLVFKPGRPTTQQVYVLVKGDKMPEPDEVFMLELSQPVNAAILKPVATGTIVNDDGVAVSADATAETLKINQQQNIKVWPNPAVNSVNVALEGFSGKVMIQLSDLAGKVLRQDNLQLSALKLAQQSINVSNYANGVYLLTVTDEKGNKQTQKVVISR